MFQASSFHSFTALFCSRTSPLIWLWQPIFWARQVDNWNPEEAKHFEKKSETWNWKPWLSPTFSLTMCWWMSNVSISLNSLCIMWGPWSPWSLGSTGWDFNVMTLLAGIGNMTHHLPLGLQAVHPFHYFTWIFHVCHIPQTRLRKNSLSVPPVACCWTTPTIERKQTTPWW